jgi:hypothetical protein
MDVKKIAGVFVAFALAVPIIATTSPAALALIDIALVGVLYVIRRRRLAPNRDRPTRNGSMARMRT